MGSATMVGATPEIDPVQNVADPCLRIGRVHKAQAGSARCLLLCDDFCSL